MRSGLTKMTGVFAGALLLAGVLLPTTTSAASPTTTRAASSVTKKIFEGGCGANGAVPGTVTTSTFRGVTTTVTRFAGEVSTTKIVPVGTPATRGLWIATDENGNVYLTLSNASSAAAAAAFNRAHPVRVIRNGVVHYARTQRLADIWMRTFHEPQYIATSWNGTAFFSSCSQADASSLAGWDSTQAPKVWHATNPSTGQVVTSAVSLQAADALATPRYGGHKGELVAYGANCQILTATSATSLIAKLRAQLAAMPFVSYGGYYVGYDPTGTNPADAQMFWGATQAQANARALAFSKSIVGLDIVIIDKSGFCASVEPTLGQAFYFQNLLSDGFNITPTSITAYVGNAVGATVRATTGLVRIYGGVVDFGRTAYNLNTYAMSSTTSSTASLTTGAFTPGTFNMSNNMASNDGVDLTMSAPLPLPTKRITCLRDASAPPGPPSIRLVTWYCPINYQKAAQ